MIKIAVRMPPAVRDAGEFLADVRALEAAGAAGIWLTPAGDADWAVLGAVAAVTRRISIGVAGAGESDAILSTLDRLSGGRIVHDGPTGERWTDMPMPANREAWAAELRRHEEAGWAGVVIAWDPRLIDLLRNSEQDDRSDLLMSTG